eukprot:364535-Chlamydomonas_euryale.AAC.3
MLVCVSVCVYVCVFHPAAKTMARARASVHAAGGYLVTCSKLAMSGQHIRGRRWANAWRCSA